MRPGQLLGDPSPGIAATSSSSSAVTKGTNENIVGRLDEVDAVVLNSGGEGGLLRRLKVLGPMAAVTYSGSDLRAGGEIATELIPAAEDSGGLTASLG